MALYKILFDHIMVPHAPGYGIVDPAEVDPADREQVYYARYSKADYNVNEALYATVELPSSVADPLVAMGAIEETTEEDALREHVGVIDRTVAGREGPNALTNTQAAASMDILGHSAKPHVKNTHHVTESSPEEFTEQRDQLAFAGDDHEDLDGADLPLEEKEPQEEPQKRASGQSGADQPRKSAAKGKSSSAKKAQKSGAQEADQK